MRLGEAVCRMSSICHRNDVIDVQLPEKQPGPGHRRQGGGLAASLARHDVKEGGKGHRQDGLHGIRGDRGDIVRTGRVRRRLLVHRPIPAHRRTGGRFDQWKGGHHGTQGAWLTGPGSGRDPQHVRTYRGWLTIFCHITTRQREASKGRKTKKGAERRRQQGARHRDIGDVIDIRTEYTLVAL